MLPGQLRVRTGTTGIVLGENGGTTSIGSDRHIEREGRHIDRAIGHKL